MDTPAETPGNSQRIAFIHSRMMPLRCFSRAVYPAAFVFACTFYIPRLCAQAPPGPIQLSPDAPPPSRPPVHLPSKEQEPARKDIQGFWKLNRDQSDDARQKIQAARANRNSNPNGPYGGPGGGYPGQYPGGGYPGGGPFPFPGGNGPYGGPRQTGNNDEIDPRMLSLLPPDSLNVAKEASDVELTDDKYHRLVLYTDGRKIEKSKDDRLQEANAHWENDVLVSDEKSPTGAKMSRTVQLSSDGRRLEETLHIEQAKSSGPITIHYVFDAAKPQ